MDFNVIPDQQTPELAMIQDEFIGEYINMYRKRLLAFLEYAKTRNDAVGLACNQVALDENRFIVRAFAIRNTVTKEWSLVIDPIITKYVGIKEIKAEGCLTWKGRLIVAERSRAVNVSYYDIDGNFHEETHKGFDAQIWQHEVNHLNGIEEDVRENFTEPKPIEVGRNEPCPCGSNLKYKHCCLILK